MQPVKDSVENYKKKSVFQQFQGPGTERDNKSVYQYIFKSWQVLAKDTKFRGKQGMINQFANISQSLGKSWQETQNLKESKGW